MDDLLEKVLHFYKEQKWKGIMELNKFDSEEAARKLLWVWPSESNLLLIKDTVEEFNMEGVISIGCGCGLFEWLLGQYSGLPVVGYEVNKEWWASRYSNPQFIKLTFPKQPPTPDILTPGYALLFCYFNNGGAFKEYVRCYEGNVVFIVGPGVGAGRHTNPTPFTADFGSEGWSLYKSEEVRDTKDFIAVYTRQI